MMRLHIKKGFAKAGTAFILALTLLSGTPAWGEDPKASPASERLAIIRQMEVMLLRPCDRVEALMNDLIRYGKGYQRIEEDRAAIYAQWQQAFKNQLAEFIVEADETGATVPGRFRKAFDALQKKAEEGGVLAKESIIGGNAIALVHSEKKNAYFYFEDLNSTAANNKRELRDNPNTVRHEYCY
jgi:hypothetical protein